MGDGVLKTLDNGPPAMKKDGAPEEPRPEQAKAANPQEAQKKLQDLLETMWKQSKSIVLQRLLVLEEVIASLEAGLSDGSDVSESRKAGADASHKLAGILGTFGLPRGTDLAREAEVTLEQAGLLDAANMRRLRSIAEELKLMIGQRSLPDGR